MGEQSGSKRLRTMLLLVGLVLSLGLVAAACGGGDEEAPPATTEEAPATTEEAPPETDAAPPETDAAPPASGNIQAAGACGLGTGEAATGDPIKIGGIATNVPGIDFTWITGMTKAYFDCVNDNGGINGRPIEYIAEEEQIDPQQIASLATKLIEQDQVARPRRQHEHHRLLRQRRLLRRAGLLPDHRRRRPGLLHAAELLGREHGPVLLEPRRRAGGRPGRGDRQDRRRLPEPARLRRHQQRRHRVRRAERHGGHQRPRGRAHRRPGGTRPEARAAGR